MSYIYIIGIAILAAAQFASAGIDRQARNNFRSSSMIGECFFGIDELEPYEIINSDCETLKMTTGAPEQLAIRPLRAFSIGWPRTGYKEWYWYTPLFDAPDPDELYCQNMGYSETGDDYPKIDLGPHSESDEEPRTIDGHQRCGSPIALIKAYFVPFCFGTPDNLLSVASLEPSIHISFRYNSGSSLCWWVAVETSQ